MPTAGLTDHVTVVSAVPETEAANAALCEGLRVTLLGAMATVIGGMSETRARAD